DGLGNPPAAIIGRHDIICPRTAQLLLSYLSNAATQFLLLAGGHAALAEALNQLVVAQTAFFGLGDKPEHLLVRKLFHPYLGNVGYLGLSLCRDQPEKSG